MSKDGSRRRGIWKNPSPKDVLPVGALQPTLDDRLLGKIVGVLEIEQAEHQPGG